MYFTKAKQLCLLCVISLASLGSGEEKSPKEYDLIILSGQSNAVGFETKRSQLPVDPIDQDVLFWWRFGDPPADEFDTTSNQEWTTLQAQPKGKPKAKDSAKRQYGNFKYDEGGFGPEMGLARTLIKQQPHRPLAIVKVAYSGTSITEWGSSGKDGPTLYDTLLSETKVALEKAESKGIKLNLRAFVWVQGESDAKEKYYSAYQDNLEELIAALKKDLNAPDLITLLGVNARFGRGKNQYISKIAEAQSHIGDKYDHVAYIDSSDCETASKAHFSSKGTLELGVRFAEALLQIEKKEGSEPLNIALSKVD